MTQQQRYQGNRPRGGGGTGNPPLNKDEARRIIELGEPELLVSKAKEVGETLNVSSTQLRRFFGEVKRIQMLWAHEDNDKRELARRRAVLLEPRLDYQVKRNQKTRPLRNVLKPCLQFAAQKPEAFDNFVDFYEALIAYAKEDRRS